MVLFICLLAGGAVQPRSGVGGVVCVRGGWERLCAEQMSCWGYGASAISALQATSPSLGHGGHNHVLVGLENCIFHPLLVGCSQPWTGMQYHHGPGALVCVP